MKQQNKKGLSHVELVVSFAMFVAFIAIVFLYIKPVREPTLSSVMLDIVETALKKQTSSFIGIIPFSVSEPQGSCFEVEIPLSSSEFNMQNIAIMDSNMELLSEKFFITSSLHAKIATEQESFYYVLYTDEDLTALQREDFTTECPLPDYQFSVPRARETISLAKLIKIKEKYYEDYSTLKQEWNFPSNNDFSISLPEINLEMSQETPKGINIYARELKAELFENGEIKEAKIQIKVW